MIPETKICRRCLLEEAARGDILASVREKVDKLPAADRCSEEEYRARLDACLGCGSLSAGLCLKCGCYVEFRAAVKRMKCPNPAYRKW